MPGSVSFGGVPNEPKVTVDVYHSLSPAGGRRVTPESFLSISAIPEGVGDP